MQPDLGGALVPPNTNPRPEARKPVQNPAQSPTQNPPQNPTLPGGPVPEALPGLRQTTEPQTTEPQTAELQTASPQTASPQTHSPQTHSPQSAETQPAGSQGIGPQGVGLQGAGPQDGGRHGLREQDSGGPLAVDQVSGLHGSGAGLSPVPRRVGLLNNRYRHHGAVAVLEHALGDPDLGRVALVSSFGAESVALLHLVSVVAPDTPVLFVDTRMLFAETLAYQRDLAETLDLRDIRVIRAGLTDLAAQDGDNLLHRRDTDACCTLRKTLPLERALTGFDAWITGRKRYQASTRAALEFFEEENGTGRIKVNPLAHWGKEDVAEYLLNNRLPRHPLVAQGYPSIGCAPCTSAVKPGEDERAGRWRGSDKTECGIHFIDGRMVRGPIKDSAA